MSDQKLLHQKEVTPFPEKLNGSLTKEEEADLLSILRSEAELWNSSPIDDPGIDELINKISGIGEKLANGIFDVESAVLFLYILPDLIDEGVKELPEVSIEVLPRALRYIQKLLRYGIKVSEMLIH